MKICIAGSRNWTDMELVQDWIDNYVYHDILILGGCPNGVDNIAEIHAKTYNIEHKLFLPDWDKHGRAAGPIRNEQMVKEADKVVVFWDGKSKGSKSTIDFALKYKKHLEVIFNEQTD